MSDPFIVPVVLFISIAAIVIMRGPFGRALADRMAGRHLQAPSPDAERLAAEVDELRRRLADVEERLDFAERVIARDRERQRIEPGA